MAAKGPGFAVLYRWRLHPGAEAAFVDAWSRVSECLREQRGSLGSRLHRGPDGWFYSYAQWPSAEARTRAFAMEPVDAEAGARMHAAIAESLPELILEPLADWMLPPTWAVNRSMPRPAVVPVLSYPDVREAAAWLCRAFGFVERLRIGNHRAQLAAGDGALVIAQDPASGQRSPAEVMVRVADVDAHCAAARRAGAVIRAEPQDFPYGERQYGAIDPAGHRWTFSQTLADVDPASWGGERCP